MEDRLLALSPPEVQAQMVRLQAPLPTPDELAEVERALAAWEAEAEARDRALRLKEAGAVGVKGKRWVRWG